MIGAIVSVAVLLAMGVTCCLLLYYRNGPFAPYSSTSLMLGLDAAIGSATGTTSSSSQAVASPIVPVSSTPATTPQAQVVTATPVNYLSVTGADMSGQDMSVTGDDGKPATSQGTYGPAGCTAICSGNAGCMGSVYSPSTKTCWIKSGFTEGNVAANSDRVLSLPMNPLKGSSYYSTSYTGPDIIAPVLPTFSDCSTLCQMVPDCAGVVYDNSYGKTCHIKSAISAQVDNTNTNAWVKAAQH